MIRIVLFEDSENLRDSLKIMLMAEPEFELVGIFHNCTEAPKHVIALNPDVILMDIDLPETSGIDGVRNIKKVREDVQIIMLTVFDDDEKIFQSIQAGADGYILKKRIPFELISAIHNSFIGGSTISPGVAAKVLQSFRKSSKKIATETFELSKREQEVLELLTKGYSYKKIASDLFVSIDTIGSHIKNIYSKLQVNSAPEAVAKALKYKIVDS